jgi:DNA-binding FadR family transcriptional regulator
MSSSGEPATVADQHAGAPAYRPGYQIAAERLVELLAEWQLSPGERLPTEQRLAEILGTSRSVTREAVKILAALGRISVRKGAGIYVAEAPNPLARPWATHFQPTDLVQVRMLFDYRNLVEGETARLAATVATPREVRDLQAAADASRAAAEADDNADFARCDHRFHDALAAASHNVFLESSLAMARHAGAQVDEMLFHGDKPGSLITAAGQHQEVAEAVAAADPRRAADAIAGHISTTRAQFERRLLERMLASQSPAR